MGADYAALERIRVCRATSVAEQVESVRLLGDASVILIDNVTDLFAYEYYRKHTRPAGNRRLAGHLRELSMLALDRAVPIVLTNMIRYSGSGQVESLAHIVDLYTHFKLYLEGSPECTGRISMAGRQERFGYRGRLRRNQLLRVAAFVRGPRQTLRADTNTPSLEVFQ